jgi:hypothetical protein
VRFPKAADEALASPNFQVHAEAATSPRVISSTTVTLDELFEGARADDAKRRAQRMLR